MTKHIGLFFASMNVCLSVGASVGYFLTQDWKRGLYWFCGAAIASVVTYMKD